jgi:hypothetical protein
MQILTKEIEENARWKEETKERFDAEQKELKTQQRMLKVAKVAPGMLRSEFENMSDETFEMFFTGIENAFNDKIEAEKKAEEERISKEKSESEAREKMRIENERLKIEAKEKEKQIAAERAAADAERKAIEAVAQKEREAAAEKLKAEQAAAKAAAEKAAAEKAKLEAEIKAKADAEEAERKAKEAADKKAKNAPDASKLIALAAKIDGLELPDVAGEEAKKIIADVKSLLAKVSGFIIEKSKNI